MFQVLMIIQLLQRVVRQQVFFDCQIIQSATRRFRKIRAQQEIQTQSKSDFKHSDGLVLLCMPVFFNATFSLQDSSKITALDKDGTRLGDSAEL